MNKGYKCLIGSFSTDLKKVEIPQPA